MDEKQTDNLPEEKPKQIQRTHAGKSKRELSARAKIIIQSLIKGSTETEALKIAGYSDSYIHSGKDNILHNPVMQKTFNTVLESAGVTDSLLADKIRSLIDAKEVKFYAHQGIVTDEREVEALSIQAQMVEFAAKLKGHVRSTPEPGSQGTTYIDLSSINVQINGHVEQEHTAIEVQPVDNSAVNLPVPC